MSEWGYVLIGAFILIGVFLSAATALAGRTPRRWKEREQAA